MVQIDILSALSLSYEEVQQHADKMVASSDEKQQSLGKQLKEMPEEYFAISKGQKKLQSLLKFLQGQGYTDEQLMHVLQALIQSSVTIAEDNLDGVMSDEVRASWKEFLETRPNTYQQIIMLNQLAKQLTGKDLDEVMDLALTQVVEKARSVLEMDLVVAQRIESLSPEAVEQVNKYFKEGNYLEAFNLIYKNQG